MKTTVPAFCVFLMTAILSGAVHADMISLQTGAESGGTRSFHDPDYNNMNRRTGDAATRHQDANWSVTYNWDGAYAALPQTSTTRKRAYQGYGEDGARSADWEKMRKSLETSLQLLGSNVIDDRLPTHTGEVDGRRLTVVRDVVNGSSQFDGGHHYVGSTTALGGNGHTTYTAAADYFDPGDRSLQNGYGQLVRDGSDARVATSTMGEADYMTYHRYNETTRTWERASDIFHVGSSSQASKNTGITDVASGLYGFTTGFDFDADLGFINGYFSVLGKFEDVYINGIKIDDSLFWMGENTIDSDYAHMGSWDFELDLSRLLDLDILNENGNNNITFMVDYLPGAITGVGNSWNHGLGGFVADLHLNSDSINNVVTPEPAPLLILGAGLVALTFVRRLRRRRSENCAGSWPPA